MGDGVNIAARLEGICEPGTICLSEDAYRQVKGRLDLAVTDLGQTQLKNIADFDPGLFAAGRRPRPGEASHSSRTPGAKKAPLAGAARRWDRSLAHRPRGRGTVAPGSEPARDPRNELAGASRIERDDAC